MLASGRTSPESGGQAKRDAGGAETTAGGVLAETMRPFLDETRSELAPARSIVVEKPEDLPFSAGLIVLALTGLAFAGVVGAVTNHVLGGRLR